MVLGKDVRRVETSDERRISVLVVDDDPVIQKIHKMMLKKCNILETQVAENGKQAVDLHRCGAIFDLILMDMEMPIMNGIQVKFISLLISLFIYKYIWTWKCLSCMNGIRV